MMAAAVAATGRSAAGPLGARCVRSHEAARWPVAGGSTKIQFLEKKILY